ncbi:efflux RND transporter permease subunit [Dysgonomonas sp. 216]|uniref:efflux RND transporter permease subunit n=1 Tax=Dysgonomonas sp. 216 TaxID=2302934 RepID=UPI0013D68480|nr:efflux RND transporter permease subunit [Dysgonomonas sp. 216]NDW17710.1 efflux RND transporter permease subunit [Dysgonomonas sp. 216]
MLNKIIDFSLHNRMLVVLSSILLLLVGTYITINMEVDVFPDLNAPTVVVMTEANGMAPEEVERLVTFPIETSVNGATNVRRVRSSSTTGFSVVWVEFDWGTDIYKARQIVSEKIAGLGEQLPSNAGTPTLGPQSSILGEVLFIGLTADSTSLQDLRTLADWTIRPRLLATGGVAQVSVIGGEIKEYQILLDPARMRLHGISIEDVEGVAQDMNLNASGGILYEYGNEYIIRGIVSTNDVEEIGKTVVVNRNSYPVLLSDVADIKIGNKSPKLGLASEKGQPAVLLTVTKQPNTNTLELTGQLEHAVDDLKKSLPEDVHMSTDIFRQSRFIENSISNIQKALIEGSIFVVIVLFFFLMSWRTTGISLIAMPLSLIVAVLVLRAMGLTLNTMSLGGMAIAIGSLVDDAIIDVENVFKRLRENHAKPEKERTPTLTVIFNSSVEIRSSIVKATLITIVTFIPLFFLSGMEGRMLRPLGISFVVSLFASLLVALTLTPVLCKYLLANNKMLDKHEKEPWLSRKLKYGYRILLEKALCHKKLLIGISAGVFVVTIATLPFIGRSFLPTFNEGSFTITATTIPGISLDESDKMAQIVEKSLMEIPEVITVGRKTGRAELDEHSFGTNTSEIEVPFELKDRSFDELLSDIRHRLSHVSGMNFEIGQPISHRIDHMLSGTKANIAIKLFGDDLNLLYATANQIKSAISGIDGVADLNVEQLIESPQLQIKPKREILAKYGIPINEFTNFVNTAFSGRVVSQVNEEGRMFDLTLKANDDTRLNMESIGNLMLDAHIEGDERLKKVPLSYVADIVSSSGPNTINRENVQRKIVISANVAGRDLQGVVQDIQKRIDSEIKLPEGYHILYGGQFESAAAASRTLIIASIFAIVVIFGLLYQEFKSSKMAILVLINLPLALIGGVAMIWLTSGVMSIPSIIGFISLFGIATRNGILLVSHYEQLLREGHDLYHTLIQGSIDRLNPILMTALCSALALIPLAMGGDLPGNEIQSPMAQVILGGLITSTLLNGFIIPIIYSLIKSRKTADKI